MNTSLPLNNVGLPLLAINGSLVAIPPNRSVNLTTVISVKEATIVDSTGTTVKTLRVTAVGTNPIPDTYDFSLEGNAVAVGTAGATAAGSATAGDKWSIDVDGTAYTVICTTGQTPAEVRTAMTALLAANTQGFTFSSTLVGSAILYTISGTPGSGSYWNNRTITSTFPVNTGPTFSLAVETDFTGGVGVAEQFQAFLTAQGLTSYLPIITGLLVDGDTQVANGPSFMLNTNWITGANYNGTDKTVIGYSSPLIPDTTYTVAGDQTTLASIFNV